MIKFYYFTCRARDLERPGFPVGDLTGRVRVCQVYSDKARSELALWAMNHGVPKGFIHSHEGLVSHLDLWGAKFALGKQGVARGVFVCDVAWSDGRPGM